MAPVLSIAVGVLVSAVALAYSAARRHRFGGDARGDGSRHRRMWGLLDGPFRGLTKTQAEDLLDWLEAHGRTGCTVTYFPDLGFEVHPGNPTERRSS